MPYSVLSRVVLGAVLPALLVVFDGAPAQAQSAPKTRNVVVIAADLH